MTNEQVIEGINRLTETYNEVKAELNEVKKASGYFTTALRTGR